MRKLASLRNYMGKSIMLIKRSSASRDTLAHIKIGDLVADEFGKYGKVCNIEKIEYKKELHYYFYLNKAETIFIII